MTCPRFPPLTLALGGIPTELRCDRRHVPPSCLGWRACRAGESLWSLQELSLQVLCRVQTPLVSRELPLGWGPLCRAPASDPGPVVWPHLLQDDGGRADRVTVMLSLLVSSNPAGDSRRS